MCSGYAEKGRITFDFRGLLPKGSCKGRARVHMQYAEEAVVAFVPNFGGLVEV